MFRHQGRESPDGLLVGAARCFFALGGREVREADPHVAPQAARRSWNDAYAVFPREPLNDRLVVHHDEFVVAGPSVFIPIFFSCVFASLALLIRRREPHHEVERS